MKRRSKSLINQKNVPAFNYKDMMKKQIEEKKRRGSTGIQPISGTMQPDTKKSTSAQQGRKRKGSILLEPTKEDETTLKEMNYRPKVTLDRLESSKRKRERKKNEKSSKIGNSPVTPGKEKIEKLFEAQERSAGKRNELMKSLSQFVEKFDGGEKVEMVNVKKSSVMQLWNDFDIDDSNPFSSLFQSAWDHLFKFEEILEQLMSGFQLNDLIDDFSAQNYIKLSLKLRSLMYKIEEIDDINSRRSRKQRKILQKLLDIADEEEVSRTLEENNTIEFINQIKKLQDERKVRRAATVWAQEDLELEKQEQLNLNVQCQTNIDFAYIEHLQETNRDLWRKSISHRMIAEDLQSRIIHEVDKNTKAIHREILSKKPITMEEEVQTDKIPLNIVTKKKTVQDKSLENFVGKFNNVMDDISNNEMPQNMKGQMKTLMDLALKDKDLQQKEQDLEDESDISSDDKELNFQPSPRDDDKSKNNEEFEGWGVSPPKQDNDEPWKLSKSQLKRPKTNKDLSIPILEKSRSDPKILKLKQETPKRRSSFSHPKQRKKHSFQKYSPPTIPQKPPIEIKEFDISDTPDKWEKRKQEILDERKRNMKAVLKCFYTIVYEGTMYGYFKSLWNPDEEFTIKPIKKLTDGEIVNRIRVQGSSYHFVPDWTGHEGFQTLIDNPESPKKKKKTKPHTLVCNSTALKSKKGLLQGPNFSRKAIAGTNLKTKE